MFRMTSVLSNRVIRASIWQCGFVAMLAIGADCLGAVVSATPYSSTYTSTFAVSNSDLINSDQSTFSSIADSNFTAGLGPSAGQAVTARLNNGATANTSSAFDFAQVTWDSGDGAWTSVFNLNTAANSLGFTITGVNTFAQWNDQRVNQAFTLSYSTVSAPSTFTSLGTFSNIANRPSGGWSAIKVTENTTGIIATNVAALKFDFLNGGNVGGGTTYMEVDALGTAIASNNSQILISSSPTTSSTSTGASTKSIALGRVMFGSSQTTASQTIGKTGVNATTYTVTSAGDISSTTFSSGSFSTNAQSTSGTITLNTGSVGDRSGTVTIDNTATASSLASGLGSNDANDVFTVTGTVVNNRAVSASNAGSFGTVLKGGSIAISGSTNLTSSGADNQNTRVTVNNGSDSHGVTVSGGSNPTFNGSTSDSRTVSGTFSAGALDYGTYNGSISLHTNGEGLTGESAVDVGVGYSVNVGGGSTNGVGFGSALSAGVVAGGSYANLESRTLSTSATGVATDQQENGAWVLGTIGKILDGSNTTASTQSVSMAWRALNTGERSSANHSGTAQHAPAGVLPPGSSGLVSDVLQLTGMPASGPVVNGTQQTNDVFVLQMTYDQDALYPSGLEAQQAHGDQIYLAWLNPNGYANGQAQWVHATAGNFGSDGSKVFHNYQGSYSAFLGTLGSYTLADILGSYGVDTTNNQVWAVLNHNSEFAVVPEPSTMAMLLFGSAMMWIVGRKRR